MEDPPVAHEGEGAPLAGRQGRERRSGRLRDAAAVAVLMVLAVVSARTFTSSPGLSVDEGVYTAQAWAILRGSVTPYTYFYDHPPLGWAQLAPILWASEAVGWSDSAVLSARVGSVVALVCDVALLYLLARRLGVAEAPAAGTVVVFLLSPLTHDYLLRVFLDTHALPWLLAAFLVVLTPRVSDRRLVAGGALLAVAALTKESSLLMYPALFAAVVTNTAVGRRRRAVFIQGAALLAVGACYPLYALLIGDLPVMVRSVAWQLLARQGSGSLTDENSRRYETVVGWLERDPVLLVAGLVAAVVLLVLRRRHWYLGLTLLMPLVVTVKPGGYLPGMFIAIAIPFLVLCPAVVLTYLTARWRLWTVGWTSTTLHLLTCLGLVAVASSHAVTSHGDLTDQTSGELSVARWAEANLPTGATVLVDDAIFAELYVHGRHDEWRQALMVYKLDYDANVSLFVPRGWKEVEFAVVTPKLRQAASAPDAEQAQAVLQNGEVIARLGGATGDTVVLRVRTLPMGR